MSIVHLHNHTHYSLLDGLSRPKECVSIAKKHKAPAVAMTDHGVLYGVIEFYKEAKKEDINPIIGCEIYVAPMGRFKKEVGTSINHLTVLAYNNDGYQNIIQLVTKAHLEGYYYKPRVDHGLLKEYSRGLIALSGCVASELGEAATANDEKKMLEIIKLYQEIFGKENFFLEVMDHPEMTEQVLMRQKYFELGKRLKVPVVATNDNHYARKEDREAHDILLCIQTNRRVQDQNRMKYEGDYSMRSPEDMKAAFHDHPEAIENTLEIAKRCKVEIKLGKNLIPAFEPPNGKDPDKYLRELCEEGLKERYGKNPQKEILERLDYELSVIHKSGFDTYFLIVSDFVRYAKERGVIVGPGRGSAAGSIVSYSLKITDIDPLEYGLLFERFLNPERVSMPDIDIDFDDERRNEVLDYVVSKYGRENVAQIVTFGTMAARAAVRDTGRALGYPYGEVDRIAKFVPPPQQGRHIPLDFSIKEDPELRKVYSEEPRSAAVLDMAMKLEGTIRQAGTHACAVVIAKEPLTKYTPLQIAPGGESEIITQFSMKPIEDLGLLKIDMLGLKNLTILRRAAALVEKRHGVKIDFSKIPLDDKKTFELLAKGETTGVFQLESQGMRHYLKDLRPTKIQDIIAMVSLYRPGPMPWIPMYIRGKHKPEEVKYLHSSFEPILKETYGVAVYQEQILEIAKSFAGFTLGEADILRKAVGKKDPKLLEEQREKFIEGAIENGHTKKQAEMVFEKVIEPFAAYGFNKAHATCYAFIAYQTAYLKANYPTDFMSALMSADADNMDRIVIEVNECEEMGISVLPPSVNESYSSFTVVDDRTIRFGLKAIKGLGDAPINAIIEAREKGGPFRNIEDFAKRVPFTALNKKSLEALAYSGALDPIGERKALAASTEEIVSHAKQSQQAALGGQVDIFSMMDESVRTEHLGPLHIKKIAPATRLEKLNFEKELLGLYVSGHPLQGLRRYLAKKIHFIASLNNTFVGKRIKIGGLVTKVKKVLTKSGVYMAYVEIEDLSGRMEVVVFPKVYQSHGHLAGVGSVIFIEGKVSLRGDAVQFIADSFTAVSLDSLIESAKQENLYDENEKVRRFAKRDSETEEIPDSILYTIEIPDHASPQTLETLKKLFMENRGQGKVIIKIPSGSREAKTVAVPFGVAVTQELKQKIKDMFQGAKSAGPMV